MTVLFGFSKKEGISQNNVFFKAAVTIAAMSSILLCTVRNSKVKLHEDFVEEESIGYWTKLKLLTDKMC